MSPMWNLGNFFSSRHGIARSKAPGNRSLRAPHHSRRLRMEPLEDRSLLAITLGFDSTPLERDTSSDNLRVNFTVGDGPTQDAFDVKLIAVDNSSNEYELMSTTVAANHPTGSDYVTFTGALNYQGNGDVMKDYELKVVLDPAGTSGRTNPAPDSEFTGVFMDSGGLVIVQGDASNEYVTASASGGTLYIAITENSVPVTTSLSSSAVSAMHVRMRSGDDTVYLNSNVQETFWGFAGASGTQSISGGSATNTIFGGGGANTLVSGEGGGTITAGTGSNAITATYIDGGEGENDSPYVTVNVDEGAGNTNVAGNGYTRVNLNYDSSSHTETISATGADIGNYTVSYSSVVTIALSSGSGADAFTVQAPNSGTLPAFTVNLGSGSDTLTVLGKSTADSMEVASATSVSFNGLTLSHSNVESIVLDGGDGNDTFTLTEPGAGTLPPISIVGNAGSTDLLTINAAASHAVNVSNSQVQLENNVIVNYSSTEAITVNNQASGTNTLSVSSPSGGSVSGGYLTANGNTAFTIGGSSTLITGVGYQNFGVDTQTLNLTNIALDQFYDVTADNASHVGDIYLAGSITIPGGLSAGDTLLVINNEKHATLHGGFSTGNIKNPFATGSNTPITIGSEVYYVDYSDDIALWEESFAGGVQVTTTNITTHHDLIPRFGAAPTVKSIATGNWSDGSTWSTGSVPTTDDVVKISAGTTVTYNVNDDTHAIKAVEVAGTLKFATSIDTELLVATLEVLPIGTLEIGTAAGAIAADKTARLTFADQAFSTSTSNNPDPAQYGIGLVSFGNTTMHGSEVAETWVRLAAEAFADDTTLVVKGDFSDWELSDRLVLPDTRQPSTAQDWQFVNHAMSPVSEWEVVEVDYVIYDSQTNLSVIHLKTATPVVHDHLGPRDYNDDIVTIHTDEDLLPHVARLTRNVVLSSENPSGTRGHTMYGGRGFADLNYVAFQDLGRTDALAAVSSENPEGGIDNTEFNSSGAPTSIGVNQTGRYAAHFHHVLGPMNDPQDPDMDAVQFKFIGNTVENFKKWAVAVHDSSWGLLQDNVVYNGQGSGFVTEEGNEINNVFDHNITIALNGTFGDGKAGLDPADEIDYGRGGNGFWFRRGGNIVTGNVAADSTYAGFNIDGYFPVEITLPDFPGAYIEDADQSTETEYSPGNALHTFEDNEAYGMSFFGMWGTYLQGNVLLPNVPETVISDFRAWHLFNSGIWFYYTANVTFDGLLLLNDHAKWDRNDGGSVGLRLSHYYNFNVLISNADIEGFTTGIVMPQADGSRIGAPDPTVIQNSTLSNYTNILVTPPEDAGAFGGNWLEVNDVLFPDHTVLTLPTGPLNPANLAGPSNIRMLYTGLSGAERYDYSRPSIVMVNNYDGTTDDFEVFYAEQAHDLVMIESDADEWYTRSSHTTGAPIGASITNEDAWSTLGFATLGIVAPENADDDYDGIIGLVGAQHNFAADTRKAVIVTPFEDAVYPYQPSGYLSIRYTMQGLLGANEWIWLVRDEGTASEIYTQMPSNDNAPVSWNALPGHHTLRAFIGDASHNQISGTEDTEVEFDVRGFSIAPVSQVEGNSGTTQFLVAVAISLAINEEVTVQYATSNWTAVAGIDYTATSGTLTFAPNQTTAMITVDVLGDTSLESNETFKITLSNSSSLEVPIALSWSWGTIQNDD